MLEDRSALQEPGGTKSDELLRIFGARRGVVCVIGAGGKKSTLYRLAAAHPGCVGVSATVHIPYFPVEGGFHEVVERPDELLQSVVAVAGSERRIAFACPSEKRARWSGVPPSMLDKIHDAVDFDLLLIKADGARARLIKAPDGGEPQLPSKTDTVIALISARAIGRPLDERVAHRVGAVTRLSGARPGETLTPEHVGEVLVRTCELAGRDSGVRVIPVVNMVDDSERKEMAEQVAHFALASSDLFDRVVLSCMAGEEPVVSVIQR